MGASERVISVVFALTGSLIVALFVVSGNESILQSAANSIFGKWIQDPTFRFYLLDALIVGAFILVGSIALHGAKGNAIEAMETA
jgi:hypothetical protein